MTRQTSESTKRDDDADITVLFGTDEHGKPRAAWFKAANPELITKAATAMKLQLLRPVTASQIELAKKLPVGRIHANGTGFVPPIRGDLYSELQLAAEPPQASGTAASTVAPSPAAAPAAPAHGLPKDWDNIEVGHLVIAQECKADKGIPDRRLAHLPASPAPRCARPQGRSRYHRRVHPAAHHQGKQRRRRGALHLDAEDLHGL